jgi:hypothetical protein
MLGRVPVDAAESLSDQRERSGINFERECKLRGEPALQKTAGVSTILTMSLQETRSRYSGEKRSSEYFVSTAGRT